MIRAAEPDVCNGEVWYEAPDWKPHRFREGKDDYREGDKNVYSHSFHSLRHSFSTIIANNNVSEEVRMRLTGHTTRSVHQRAVQRGIDLPITAEIYRVLYEDKDPLAAVNPGLKKRSCAPDAGTSWIAALPDPEISVAPT